MTQENSHDLLESHKLIHDPRIAQAKQLLLDALNEAQSRIQSVQPPKASLEARYSELVQSFSKCRGGNLYFPYIGSGFGKGALVELLDGSIKYDLISGIGVHYYGHLHPALVSTGIDAALSDTIMQGHLEQNNDALQLSELLIQASGMDHCFLSSSGAMANENALKIALHKKFPAQRILAFDHCFMGRTLTLAQITDKPSFRENLPCSLPIDYVPFYDYKQPEESTKNSLKVLKSHLDRYPNQHAVMCFELVQGEGGVYPGTTEFFIALMELLRQHKIVIFVDEIQTFGRTPSLFAYQYFHLESFVDLVTIGKLSQVCATLFKTDFKPRPGLLSQTFTSSTSAIRSSYYIISQLMKKGFFGSDGKIMNLHHDFVERLKNLEKKYPDVIAGPYGIGGMIAFTPYGGDQKRVTEFTQALFHEGIISFTAGSHPTRVRFLLPVGALDEQDLDPIFHILEKTILRG